MKLTKTMPYSLASKDIPFEDYVSYLYMLFGHCMQHCPTC